MDRGKIKRKREVHCLRPWLTNGLAQAELTGVCVNEWLLKIELKGEWEECSFLTRKEALSTFVALAADYNGDLRRAVLFAPEQKSGPLARFNRDRQRLERPN